VGSTWFISRARGTVANVESKLLLLDHAFSNLAMRRIHIQADVRNERSRASIAALGATFEGVLRRHIVLPDGSSRDTAVYSILLEEWPSIRTHIEARASRKAPGWRSGLGPMNAGQSMLEAV
jgi:RimJ/RimL family protein N-acetyltransferase